MPKERILVVDDEAISRENLALILSRDGYETLAVENGEKAVAALEKQDFDLVLTDLRMKGLDGIQLLEHARRLQPETEVILLTGYATVDTAVEAMRKGAYHYVAKPYKIEELRILVSKAIEKRRMRSEITELRRRIESDSGLVRFVGQSPEIRALKETIAQVAQLDCNVLILGETGTGKELVARIIHELSPRSGGRFMAINCGAFSAELIDNELFGHEKDAYTGAGKARKGLLETANGGTVFFDEVGELPLPMQVKLLRVLQERRFLRVGGTEEIPVDIRILAATNKDLKKEVEQGEFRQDLYYRLDVISLRIPPLSERKDDIAPLVRHFLAKHGSPGGPPPRMEGEAMDLLRNYAFPGNVRELENIIERAMALSDGTVLETRHLPEDLRVLAARPSRGESEPLQTLEENEKRYILKVLEEVDGNKTRAAEILGIDRVSLWRKLKRFDLGD